MEPPVKRNASEQARRPLPVDPHTGEIYTFDAGNLADHNNLLWLIGGSPSAVYRLGVELTELAVQGNIELAALRADVVSEPGTTIPKAS